ncbi:MAG: hypothetical protein Q4A05_02180 [Ruminococcus sp.]|nr:hypothetical protein [Ruminococcus sp.]
MKRAKLLAVGALAALLLSGCSPAYDTYESSEKADVLRIAGFTFGLADSGRLSADGSVTERNIGKYTDNKRIIAIYNDDWNTNTTVLLDNDTVLIEREVIFQGAKGYVVTRNDKSIDSPTLTVPLGYDGNRVGVTGEADFGCDGVKVYSYSAGL